MIRILVGTIVAVGGVAMLMEQEWLGGSLLLCIGGAIGSGDAGVFGEFDEGE